MHTLSGGLLAWLSVCLSGPYADLHMGQRIPLPLTVSCFSKIQIGFTFLVPAHPGSPGRRAFKLVCVCVHWIHTDKTSLCSASYDNVALSTFGRRMPCCHAASAGDIAIDRYLLLAGPTAANPPQLHVQWQKWNSSNCCKNTAQWQVILNILVLVGFVNYSLKTVLLDTVQGTRCTEDHLNDETLLNGLDWSCMKHSTWPKIKVGEVLHSASMVIRPWEERQTRAITYFQTHKYKTLNCLQHVQLK